MNFEPQLFKQFQVIRFRPDDIILFHKQTKKHYQYHQILDDSKVFPNVKHPTLQRPLVSSKSVLYLKPQKILDLEINNRCLAHNKLYFSQQQLVNTFQPILQCLKSIHSQGVSHGSISKSSIIFDKSQQVKLCDWLISSKYSPYYPKKSNSISDDDYRAIGLIIIECASLSSHQKMKDMMIQQIIEQLIPNYSKNFVISIIVLVKNIEQHYQNIGRKLGKNIQIQIDEKLQRIYQNIKINYQRKKLNENNGQISPNKFFLITTSRKTMKLQQQNKKVGLNQDIKKKHIEKITKIIQRSNAFVNQLIARRVSDSKKANPKVNSSYQGNQNSNIRKPSKQSSSKQNSPTKKLRFLQKKK